MLKLLTVVCTWQEYRLIIRRATVDKTAAEKVATEQILKSPCEFETLNLFYFQTYRILIMT